MPFGSLTTFAPFKSILICDADLGKECFPMCLDEVIDIPEVEGMDDNEGVEALDNFFCNSCLNVSL